MNELAWRRVFWMSVLIFMTACSSQKTQHVTPVKEAPALSLTGLCAPEQGAPFSYRKKVAVLATDVRDPQRDLPAFDVAWSHILQQRLRESGRLLVVDASDQHIYSGDTQQAWMINLAKRLNVQFVVAATFHSMHASRSQFGRGNYTISLPGVQRQIDAELAVYDGYSGNKLAAFSQSAYAKGREKEVLNLSRQPVLKGAFLNTELGEAMASVLASQVEEGLAKLACLPLMERVLNVAGRDIHINVGGASLIRPGDTLQLFRRHGTIEDRLGPIEVVRVFPESVVAVYRGEKGTPGASPGLFVRAW